MVAYVPAFVARTGYTGEPGVEILCPWDLAPRLWDALTGGAVPATPAGLVARDTLRTEMGYPLYGNELSRGRGPVAAGLKWACDTNGLAFAGADAVRRTSSTHRRSAWWRSCSMTPASRDRGKRCSSAIDPPAS